ncbi:hypothetical protein GCM10025859_34660 [Alicyclobacillus fastidiosus]|nr:hypothetical protein GCM10025859_34660 [Alicyclobacillus fastidiosus]
MRHLPREVDLLGEDVKAAVYTENGELDYKTLKEIQPYHWAKAYAGET